MNALRMYETPINTLSTFFDDLLTDGFFFNRSSELAKGSWPNVDVIEENDAFVLKADLPGVDKDEIKISVEDRVLTLHGERKEEKKDIKKGTYQYYERSYGAFERSFALPETVDENSIEAQYKNGVLELRMKKAEKAQPKKIEIKPM